MKKLDSEQLRKLYLDFYNSKQHAVIESASLIPENDPTVLFTTAGMHPLVPYLLGEKHPAGKRLTDVQICVRTGDIESVGDASHCTFFEMLGSWSLGDYFKQDAIKWSYELLLEKLEFDKDKFAVTVFAGDENCPRDEESAKRWAELGIDKDKIFYLDKKHNWWGPAGMTGPCGPDTEMFIDTGKPKCSDSCSPACDCGKYMEIGNDVFMQYFKNADGKFEPLQNKNVDQGMGLERMLCILNGYKSVFETDLFSFAIKKLEELSGKKYGEDEEVTKAMRIIADHTRTATFLLGDRNGVSPSNVDQGYVLRRLIRRAMRYCRTLGVDDGALAALARLYVEKYKNAYPYIKDNEEKIVSELTAEKDKFAKTIEQGLKEFDKVLAHLPQGMTVFPGKTAFRLYDTFGFPIEMTEELAKERGFVLDMDGYKKAFSDHQALSKAGAEQKFKGGLADNGVQTARLHSATHLLNAALKIVLKDNNIQQKGSNITAERLRFDFNFPRPLTAEEIAEVEKLVNEQIALDVEVKLEEMTVEQAKSAGAIGVFSSKYGDIVKVYTIGFSKEICGGPHASRTGELGKFKIIKEQSSSAGVRRIKAILA
ncbi:MAG: alanine--tRNA ligase [Bacteroides sp.]|nr:alanine--tRNA ligase [Bacillota bacterium]MCM1394079.1 alanine--tRNA ligase [[Eubacterium] siraeum]MCM1455851.1 alanine--tRNA ligase [Bacteroides sp.]